ncbi:HET-domain-containing protein [Cubamyces sp. BRFM 1775]|nr:HET-domain-containing protein [Cubamyces sp. BRFM 1775]
MRLLSTRTGQFCWVTDPRQARYAILSHTWSKVGEQCYQDVLKLQRDVEKVERRAQPFEADLRYPPHITAPAPIDHGIGRGSVLDHPKLSGKIRSACAVALEDSYELLWIDACCIDKSSSAELTEAVNSMFEWYSRADVCYVYLEDVDDDDNVDTADSQFRQARWHRRGWTLQELIAPRSVVFLSSGWCPMGMKSNLARLLEEITGVDHAILTHKVSLSTISVARRMSWASRRETTRPEDEAYSLMGIFGVHMAPIYGEGRNAFVRLQEEILKAIPDQSIFAWGRKFPPPRPASCPPVLHLRSQSPLMPDGDSIPWTQSHSLLARSPSDFYEATSSGVTLISHKQFTARLDIETAIPLPEYTITSYGVRTQLPLIPANVLLPRKDTVSSDLAWSLLCECDSSFQHVYLALLRCQDEVGRILALPLCLPTRFFKEGVEHVFLVGTRIDACTTCPRPYRLWSLSSTKVLRARDHIFVAELRIRRSPLRTFTIPEPRFTPRRMKITDVVLNSRCITALAAQGYRIVPPQRSENPFYRIHAFTFLRPTEAKGTERLVVRIVQAMQRDMDEVEFRVSHQTCVLDCEEVMGRSSPLLPAAFVDLPCVNRRPGGYAIPIPGGMAWSVFDLHGADELVRTLRLTLRAMDHRPRVQLAILLSKNADHGT